MKNTLKKEMIENNILNYNIPEDQESVPRSRTIDTHIFINSELMGLIKVIGEASKKELNLKLNKSKLINIAIFYLIKRLKTLSLTDSLFLLKSLEVEYLDLSRNSRGFNE